MQYTEQSAFINSFIFSNIKENGKQYCASKWPRPVITSTMYPTKLVQHHVPNQIGTGPCTQPNRYSTMYPTKPVQHHVPNQTGTAPCTQPNQYKAFLCTVRNFNTLVDDNNNEEKGNKVSLKVLTLLGF